MACDSRSVGSWGTYGTLIPVRKTLRESFITPPLMCLLLLLLLLLRSRFRYDHKSAVHLTVQKRY